MNPRRVLPRLLVLTACAVPATAMLVVLTERTAAPPAPVSAPVSAQVSALGSAGASTPRETVAAWDVRRAQAWAAGDLVALRELYVAGSRAGRADVRMLTAYVDRGFRVEGLTTQVLAWEPVAESPDSLTVRVTDRIAGAVVTGHGIRAPLPSDRATTRTLTMRRVDDDWRMWAVRDGPAPPSQLGRPGPPS